VITAGASRRSKERLERVLVTLIRRFYGAMGVHPIGLGL
jgi:hypothetical protein